MKYIVVKHSILSGFFAAASAMFGKLATSPAIFRDSVQRQLPLISSNDYFEYLVWIAQSAMIAMLIISNAIMWSQYSLALAYVDVTLHVTTINTVSNFVFTALLGAIIFGETISMRWAIGVSCILAGIVLLKEPSERQLSSLSSDDLDHQPHEKLS